MIIIHYYCSLVFIKKWMPILAKLNKYWFGWLLFKSQNIDLWIAGFNLSFAELFVARHNRFFALKPRRILFLNLGNWMHEIGPKHGLLVVLGLRTYSMIYDILSPDFPPLLRLFIWLSLKFQPWCTEVEAKLSQESLKHWKQWHLGDGFMELPKLIEDLFILSGI